MTKSPISIDKDALAAKALALMNNKKITSLCVYDKKNKYKTIGVLHIHNILGIEYFLNEKKNIISIIIFFLIFLILLHFKSLKNKKSEKIEPENSEDISYSSNIIKDVYYSSKDVRGNEYSISASQGEIDYNNANIIYLTNVTWYIKLTNSDDINIKSDYGKYNTENFDTIFSKNVIIDYLDNNIIRRIFRFFD